MERLRNSKQFLLIISENSSWNRGLLNWEIQTAVETYELPLIVAYTGIEIFSTVDDTLMRLWPNQLSDKIANDEVKTLHVPFKRKILFKALKDFDLNNKPPYNITLFTSMVYDECGIG